MAGNGLKYLEMAGMAAISGNGWKQLEIAESYWNWLELPGNEWKWLEKGENG